MTTRTYTFADVSKDPVTGSISIRLVGSKEAVVFPSLSILRDEIKQAYLNDARRAGLQAIGAYLKATPQASWNPADLNGTAFTADDGNG